MAETTTQIGAEPRAQNSDQAGNDSYLRYPTCHGDYLVFVAEDDLWTAPLGGGVARRLTTSLAEVSFPSLSPDGGLLAFTGRDEHDPEVYCLPALGGPARRLTFVGAAMVRGWTPERRIIFTSSAAEPMRDMSWAFAVDSQGGDPERLPFGPVGQISMATGGEVAIGRNSGDPARWKRYRGGTAGQLWVRPGRQAPFQRLLAQLDTNVACPMLIGERVYFLSDHEGVANIYSVDLAGAGLRRHSDHDSYYARWASSDGRQIVYQHAGEIWRWDPASDRCVPVAVKLYSPRPQRQRRFVAAPRFLTEVEPHPAGHSLALVTRGKLYTMPLFEKAARQHGAVQGVRYREVSWLGKGDQLVVISDEGGEDHVEVIPVDGRSETRLLHLEGLPALNEMVPSPDGTRLAISTIDNELVILDVASGALQVADRSEHGALNDLAWSPDSAWLAYSLAVSPRLRSIKLCRLADGYCQALTREEFVDFDPQWDPDGRFVAFLSLRSFDPVPDAVYFDLGFPQAGVVCMAMLTPGATPPFLPEPKGMGEASPAPAASIPAPPPATDSSTSDSPSTSDFLEQAAEDSADAPPSADAGDAPVAVTVDLEGIAERVVALDLPPGRYRQLRVLAGKLLLANEPIHGTLDATWSEEDHDEAVLEMYELAGSEHDVLVEGVRHFEVSADRSTMVVWSGDRLRAIAAGQKPPEGVDHEGPGRKSGWIDLDRVKVSVDPGAEWRQMVGEAWRLQRDQFWVPDMSGVEWEAVLARYLPLVDKVATRSDFSDLMWELQGELGTSHAYELGGDHRPAPPWRLGRLGADLQLDPAAGHWRVAHIVTGDSWSRDRGSPLAASWVDVHEGDLILAVGGVAVDREHSPASLLVNTAGQEVELTVARADGSEQRSVVVRVLADDRPARYEEWVATNRAKVASLTDGQVGYVHIPDMGAAGFSSFHRGYLAAAEHPGLIVDVRHNGGGSVSGLVLAKLALRRLAWVVSRWGPPIPYPEDSPGGPLVALADEWAGSDGDIFSHAFKMLGLGPVVGTRTWGGVIGIEPKRRLVDGSLTTQPEYSFWFSDVAWAVENRGVQPDHEVVIVPEDWAGGNDPQLLVAVELATEALKRHSPPRPDLSERPRQVPPKLAPRR